MLGALCEGSLLPRRGPSPPHSEQERKCFCSGESEPLVKRSSWGASSSPGAKLGYSEPGDLKANRELALRWEWGGELAAPHSWGSRVGPKG